MDGKKEFRTEYRITSEWLSYTEDPSGLVEHLNRKAMMELGYAIVQDLAHREKTFVFKDLETREFIEKKSHSLEDMENPALEFLYEKVRYSLVVGPQTYNLKGNNGW